MKLELLFLICGTLLYQKRIMFLLTNRCYNWCDRPILLVNKCKLSWSFWHVYLMCMVAKWEPMSLIAWMMKIPGFFLTLVKFKIYWHILTFPSFPKKNSFSLFFFTVWTRYEMVAKYTTLYHTIQHCNAHFRSLWYSILWYCTAQHSTDKYSKTEQSTELHSRVEYSTVQYVTVQYSTGQSGNDARLRTGGSKIEGWNTASHVVKILI